jgi:hypothetical protein
MENHPYNSHLILPFSPATGPPPCHGSRASAPSWLPEGPGSGHGPTIGERLNHHFPMVNPWLTYQLWVYLPFSYGKPKGKPIITIGSPSPQRATPKSWGLSPLGPGPSPT